MSRRHGTMWRVDEHARPRVDEERCRLAPDALVELRRRLNDYRGSADLGSGWERGVPGEWLGALLEDWRAYDTGALQLQLDALRHQRVEVSGQTVHMVHAEGRGPSPLPLLLTHGWPGSFLEYLPVLPLLCDPGAHGADPADAFTVIVPSPQEAKTLSRRRPGKTIRRPTRPSWQFLKGAPPCHSSSTTLRGRIG